MNVDFQKNLHTTTEALMHQLPPFSMERPYFAVAAGITLALGGAVTRFASKRWESLADSEITELHISDPDQEEAVRNQYRSHRRQSRLAYGALTLAASSTAMHLSNPSEQSMSYDVDSIAVVIDAGSDHRAEDVEDSDTGESETRLFAGVNATLQLFDVMEGQVDVSLVLAGASAETVTLSAGDPLNEDTVIRFTDKVNEYVGTFTNTGDPNIGEGLSAAQAVQADETIVITSDDSQPTEDALRESNLEPLVIALGEPGTEYTLFGQPQVADFQTTFAGKKAEVANSTDELSQIISTNVIQPAEAPIKHPIRGYKYFAFVSTVLGWFAGGLQGLRIPSRRKGEK